MKRKSSVNFYMFFMIESFWNSISIILQIKINCLGSKNIARIPMLQLVGLISIWEWDVSPNCYSVFALNVVRVKIDKTLLYCSCLSSSGLLDTIGLKSFWSCIYNFMQISCFLSFLLVQNCKLWKYLVKLKMQLYKYFGSIVIAIYSPCYISRQEKPCM